MTLQELVNLLSNALASTQGDTPVLIGEKEIEEIIISNNKIIIK